MNVKVIIIAVVVVVILYLVMKWMMGRSTLTSLNDAKKTQTIDANKLDNSNAQGSNFTYSVWFYVTNWNYRYGEAKVILGRLDKDGEASPSIVLGAMSNDLNITVNTYPTVKSQGQGNQHTCNVQNVPLQKWVNLVVSLYGRSMDVYIDGKLVRTCVLPGVAKVDYNAPVLVTPSGGFAGFTSSVQYWGTATNPQEAWNIYKEGYGGSALGNLFNKYRVKVTFLEDNQPEGSFEI